MKTDFHFSNLLGTVYRRGNLTFTPDGSCLLSPVGNRVTVFDLVHNNSYTLPFAHRRNISRIALNPQGNLLLTIDADGRAILTNFPRRVVLHHMSFKSAVGALAFSPSGSHFAIGVGRFIEVWHTPSTPDTNAEGELEFAPFVRHHRHAGHSDVVQSVSWSTDSRFFLTASKDLTARIWSLNAEEGFTPTTLAGHRSQVKGAWFSADQETLYTVAKDGALYDWKFIPRRDQLEDEGANVRDEDYRWRISKKHLFTQSHAYLTCANFHAKSGLVVAGFSNGLFVLYELPEFNLIHTLSISQTKISTVTLSPNGDNLAFGSSAHGQLLVWSWRTESHLLKQQSHLDSLNTLTYTPDGTRIVTAADDGRLKLWDVRSGFCIVTFTEHTSGVTACAFAKRGSVLFTSSLDGSVRAWDLLRYRNFRTFTGPTRQQFSCLAVDPSGEVVFAGARDSFDIHIWSVQTGQLLEQLAGHEGPVSSLTFAPNGSMLVSGSWDRTVRMWNIFARTQTSEPLILQSDILSVTFRPDSSQIAVSALDGTLTFWTVATATQDSGVDARRDVSGGRRLRDRRTAANTAGTKAFHTLSYSADGTCILAAGNSKFICLFDVASGVLLKKFTVSVNLDIEGTQEFLNSRDLTEAGPRSLIDEQGEASDLDERLDANLPGAKRTGDASTLRPNQRPEIRVSGVAFALDGRAFCASTTEGLLIYTLDTLDFDFDPLDLGLDATPQNATTALKNGDFLTALVIALRLSTNPRAKLTRRVYRSVPTESLELVVSQLPKVYIPRLLAIIRVEIEESELLEFNLLVLSTLLKTQSSYFTARERRGDFRLVNEVTLVERAVKGVRREVLGVAEGVGERVDYLLEGGGGGGGLVGGAGASKAVTNGASKINGGDVDGDVSMQDLINSSFGGLGSSGKLVSSTPQNSKILVTGSNEEVDADEDEGEGEWIGLED